MGPGHILHRFEGMAVALVLTALFLCTGPVRVQRP